MALCPSCSHSSSEDIYKIENVPAHSVLLFETPKEAIDYPRGEIILSACKSCGFIWNRCFDPNLHNYSQKYEETQGFSETFNAFQNNLAHDLIEFHNLRNKKVIEIGCGKGEFISLLCDMGNNTGIGFDPAYIPERNNTPGKEKVEFIIDFYSEKYKSIHCDFLCCKMTLEHIHNTGEFLSQVHDSVNDALVFFQVPNMTYVLREKAFWDIYYEHCSYFTPQSLTNLFMISGFDVQRVWTDYNDQYLMIEATPGEIKKQSFESSVPAVKSFMNIVNHNIVIWKNKWNAFRKENKKMALWGAGSKAVAFCTTLGVHSEDCIAVDVNPHKQGTYLAGTGNQIVAPQELSSYQPDVVILMNPIYLEETRNLLHSMGLTPSLTTVDV